MDRNRDTTKTKQLQQEGLNYPLCGGISVGIILKAIKKSLCARIWFLDPIETALQWIKWNAMTVDENLCEFIFFSRNLRVPVLYFCSISPISLVFFDVQKNTHTKNEERWTKKRRTRRNKKKWCDGERERKKYVLACMWTAQWNHALQWAKSFFNVHIGAPKTEQMTHIENAEVFWKWQPGHQRTT